MHGVALKPGKPICLGAVGHDAGGDPPRVPDLGHLHLPRVRRPRDPPAGRAPARGPRRPSRRGCRRGSTARSAGPNTCWSTSSKGPAGRRPIRSARGRGRSRRSPGRRLRDRSRATGNSSRPASASRSSRSAGGPAGGPVGDRLALRRGSTGCSAMVQARGSRSKSIWVGSQGGLLAAGRGECDLAGVHLLDPATGEYNRPFLPPGVRLLPGYGRMQGIVFRPGDAAVRGAGRPPRRSTDALADPACLMVNRNRGSGTRVLIDGLLGGGRPPGYAVEPRSHNAVAAAVAQGRADWGLAIEPVAGRLWPRVPPRPRRAVRLRDPRIAVGPAGRRRLPRDPGRPGPSGASWPSSGSGSRRGADGDDPGRDRPLRRAEPADGPAQGLAPVRARADAAAGGPAGRRGRRADRGRRRARAGPPRPARGVRSSATRSPTGGRSRGSPPGWPPCPTSVELAYATATDVPFLRPAWVARLVELIGDHDLAIPEIGGYLHPLAALYRRCDGPPGRRGPAAGRPAPPGLPPRSRPGARGRSARRWPTSTPTWPRSGTSTRPRTIGRALVDAGFGPGRPRSRIA